MKRKERKYIRKSFIGMVVALSVFMLSACGQVGDKSLTLQDSEAADLDNLQEYIEFIEEDATDDDASVTREEGQELVEQFYEAANEAAAEEVYTKVEKSEESVYVELNSGLGFVYAPKVEGYLAGDTDLSILTYDAKEDEEGTLVDFIAEFQINLEENFGVSSNWEAFEDKEVAQSSFEQLKDAGEKIVFIHGHGGYSDSLGSYIQTGETYDFENEVNQPTDQRIVVNQDLKIIANAEYFDHFLEEGDLAGSLVILNACSSVADMTYLHAEETTSQLAQTLLDKGADLVVGYDRMVPSSYALEVQAEFLKNLSTPSESGEVRTADDALELAQAEPTEDADVEVLLFGDETYSFDQTEAIRAAYNDVLDNIASYDYTGAPNGQFIYALTDITGDGIPEMLVQAFVDDAVADLKVFGWSSASKKLLEPSELLPVGAASAGGFRAYVSGSQDSDGFFYTTMYSGTGASETNRVRLEEGELVQKFEWEYIYGEEPAAFEKEEFFVDWLEVEDRSAIEALN